MATIVTRSGKGSPLTHAEVDSNFTNLNTDKLETAGGSMTGNLSFGDNDKAIFGASSDLQIYHNGNHSYIADSGTGDLKILGVNVEIGDLGGYKNFKGESQGASTVYYNNAPKLATTSTGISVTGNATFADNGKAIFGAGSDLQIYHETSTGNSRIVESGTGHLNIEAANLNLKTPTGENYINCNENGNVLLRYDNAQKLTTTSTGIDVTGDVSIGDGSSSSTRFLMGTGDDSKMFHNGVDTYWINDTGNIIIRNQSDDKDILLQTDDGLGGTTTYITIDGSETDVSLHYGGAAKLATTSTGIDVTGTVTADGLTFDQVSTGINSTSEGVKQSSTGALQLDARGDVLVNIDTNNNGAGTSYFSVAADGSYTNYKLRVNENGDISFYEDTGTTAKFFWDASAENLNIGTTTGAESLSIKDNAGFQISFGNTSASSVGAIGYDNNDKLNIYGNGTTRMTIDSSGNVGIGTTSPDTSFHLSTSSPVIKLQRSGFTPYAQIASNNTGDLWFYADEGNVGSNTSMAFRVDGSEAMRIDSSGNVGIGTSSPSASLTVTDGASGGTLSIGRNAAGSTSVRYLQFGESNDYSIQSNANSYMRFYAEGTEAMRITSSGSVGIGTSSPTHKLQVYGNSGLTTINVGDNTLTTPSVYLSADATNSVARLNARSNHPLVFDTNNTERMRIDSSGNVGIGRNPRTRLEIASGNSGGDAGLDAPVFRITNTTPSADWDSGDVNGTIEFYVDDTSGNAPYDTAFIQSVCDINNGTLPSGALVFGTATYNAVGGAVERMRIDSSGHLLVGTTDAGIYDDATDQAGHNLLANGQYYNSAVSEINMILNKQNSNGDIMQFRKDGATVGSIATQAGDMTLGTGNTGFYFYDSVDAIIPWNPTSLTSNANIDLGHPSYRFKDLYLSGGVYLGGTGAANKLDDVEEGSVTISGTNVASGTMYYQKINKFVFISGLITYTTNTDTSSAQLPSLPFVVGNETAERGAISVSYQNASSTYSIAGLTVSNTSYASWRKDGGNIASYSELSGKLVYFSGTYVTDA